MFNQLNMYIKISKFLLAALFVLAPTCMSYAQSKGDVYRRNSLCVGIIANPNSNNGMTKLIYDAASDYHVSDKFNDHNIGIPVVDLNRIEVTDADKKLYKKTQKRGFFDKLNSTLVTVNNTLAAAQGMQGVEFQDLTDEELTVIKLEKFLNDKNVPALLVSKWFNASNSQTDGSYYNMSLIQERGAYNASELDILRAKETVRGMSILKDAGMELIPNTYVVLVSLKMESAAEVLTRSGKSTEADLKDLGGFLENKFSMKEDKKRTYTSYKIDSKTGKRVAVKNTKTISADKSISTQMAKKMNSMLSSLGSSVNKQMQKEARTTSGYYVTATTYLFKLDWDDDSEELFISKYYDQSPYNLLQSRDFKIRFIDFSTNETHLTEKTSFEAQNSNNIKLVKRATIQAIDKSIASLQKKHEDFKVKAPIIDVNDKDVTAFIGYKEGLDGKTKFEVLEKSYNKSKNTYRYKKVGTLKVDKKRIWDNRYNPDGLPVGVGDAEEGIIHSDVDRTFLKGSTKNLAPGMLIRQTK